MERKQLTQCQESATKAFIGFLCTNEKYMIISGAPGTGKSFLLEHLVRTLPDTHRIMSIMGVKPLNSVVVCASTNKAADVLKSAFKMPMDIKTIHSTFNITIRNDYRTGNQVLNTQAAMPIRDSLVIIDEAFTTDSKLLKVIDNLTPNCKVLLVGDHCQLLSVSEKASPLLNKGYLTSHLITPVRTDGNPVLTTLNDQLRETVETGIFKPIVAHQGIVDYVSDDEFRALMQQHFIQQRTPGHHITAYTNQRVQGYNSYIRNKQGLPQGLTVGEVVVANNSIELRNGSRTRIEKSYRVAAVNETIHTVNGVDFYHVILDGVGNVPVPADYADVKQSMKMAANEKDWSTYFDLKDTFVDLRAPYAGTAHKAQGSTYHTSYVDLQDIASCKDKDEMARLIYVAVSRASNNVVLYGNLPNL